MLNCAAITHSSFFQQQSKILQAVISTMWQTHQDLLIDAFAKRKRLWLLQVTEEQTVQAIVPSVVVII